MKLGVNIDHIATLREARHTLYPDPVVAALLAERAGADSIVAHLREDRRHIKERDVLLIKKAISIVFNLEMSINKGIVDFACDLVPEQATLVPEKRRELTTEGGIDLKSNQNRIKRAIKKLQERKIRVSLFIDPVKSQIDLAKKSGVDLIEINTGKFSEGKTKIAKENSLKKIKIAAKYAKSIGFEVAAGHGLDYENVGAVAKIKDIEELNIGHSIISRSVFVGLMPVVEEMLGLIGR